MAKKKPNLKVLVNDWLKTNRPLLYVEDNGSIGLLEEKGMQSKAFGVLTYGYVYYEDVQLFNPGRNPGSPIEEMFIEIKAADPEFFEKLNKYLPNK
jgi:hypothetical protein